MIKMELTLQITHSQLLLEMIWEFLPLILNSSERNIILSYYTYNVIMCNYRNTIVTVEENLDYEQRPNLREQTLTIVVNDTVYTDEITLTINLVDINDNTPVFLNSSYQ